jgi:hypothetical protein
VWSLASRRAPALGFLLVSAFLATRGWLRPPISPDVAGLKLPALAGASSPEALVSGTAAIRLVSVGALMLAVAAAGAAVVAWRPRWFSWVAGALFSLALAANAATALNYPGLIELLDVESEQRARIAQFLATLRPDDALCDRSTARVTRDSPTGTVSVAPVRSQERGGLIRGFLYLKYGTWLACWTALGLWFTARGSLAVRLRLVGLYAALGVALAVLVCERRLRAELHWEQAKRLEARCAFDAARRALDRAVALCPEFERLDRTWRLAGTLDLRGGAETPRAAFFRAYQWEGNREWARALALMAPLATGGSEPAVERQATRVLVERGLDEYQQGRLAAAQVQWAHALATPAPSFDGSFLLGAGLSRSDRYFPESAESAFAPLLERTADRALRADCLSILGDAYFEAGHMETARSRYASSSTAFTLPKVINSHALRGLGGM